MENVILIVEDEKPIVDILEFNLKSEGYTVLTAYDGEEGLDRARNENPDLILLDIMIPKIDGFGVCKRLRDEGFNAPILLLTAREDEEDKVLGLDTGADDYITKPFSMKELLARVGANIRRKARTEAVEDAHVAHIGDLSVYLERVEIQRCGAQIEVSQREYDLIIYLLARKNKVVSREELMEKVWGYEYYGDLRAVDVAVRRLRLKIEKNPAEPEYILTRHGIGYLLKDPD